MILCTSGTTGLSKGVYKTHSQCLLQFNRPWDYYTDKQEVFLNFSTSHWATEIMFLVVGSLHGGKRVITTEAFDAYLTVEICKRYQVTTFLTGPYAILKLVPIPELKPLENMRVNFLC